MTDPTVLETIARAEGELRIRLLAARTEADAIVAGAERDARALRAAAGEEAERDARERYERELEGARRASDDAPEDTGVTSDTDAAARDDAVRAIVAAVAPVSDAP